MNSCRINRKDSKRFAVIISSNTTSKNSLAGTKEIRLTDLKQNCDFVDRHFSVVASGRVFDFLVSLENHLKTIAVYGCRHSRLRGADKMQRFDRRR